MPETRLTVSVFKHNGEYGIFLAEDEESIILLHQNFSVFYESPTTRREYHKIKSRVIRANIEGLKPDELLEEILAAA